MFVCGLMHARLDLIEDAALKWKLILARVVYIHATYLLIYFIVDMRRALASQELYTM